MLPPRDVLKHQADDFEKHLPTWLDDEVTDFRDQYGEIVSVAVRTAPPHGTILKLASKTHSFGPMLLTPIAASNLLQLLSKVAPQIRLGSTDR
jgi:hypothetical protein